MTTLPVLQPRTDRERTGGPHEDGGAAIRMAPFNMAGVAGLLATCAAAAASAAHLLPLLLLLICPRGTHAEQGNPLATCPPLLFFTARFNNVPPNILKLVLDYTPSYAISSTVPSDGQRSSDDPATIQTNYF